MGAAPYRLAVVANRPQPYHSALFRSLAAHPRLDLTVYYLFDVGVGPTADSDFGTFQWDYPVLEGYRNHVLRNRALRPSGSRFTGSFHPELFQRLHPRFHDAVLLQGWFGLSVWLAYVACWARGLPVLFRSDANAADPVRAGWPSAKKLVLPRLFRRCHAFLTVGSRNAEFYRRWGVPEEKLFLTPYAVDNEFFQQQRAAWLPRRGEIRRQLGLPPEAVAILYAGRLAPEKRLGALVEAFHRLADPRAWLVLAGAGSERTRLEELTRSLRLPQVLFPGWQTQEQLARCYVAADIFVLASGREPWGLVINEAMNFALPVVVSDVVGAVPDLVTPGDNGMVFPRGDPDALPGCLQQLVADPARRARMGRRSLERIRHWSHQGSAEAVVQALDYARRGPGG